ncbi:MAG: DUF1849 family protein [Alphaproteobacteria bacterium]|nr:DUF1849 family protein [Alphaproteobacteria bacterium]
MNEKITTYVFGAVLAGLTAFAVPMQAAKAASAVAGPTVALHKALYKFKMVSVHSGAGVTGIDGEMYYEQNDDCDAWTSEHRFTMEYQYPERPPVDNTSHYVSFEAKDKSAFYFNSERRENGRLSEQLRGAIVKGKDGAAKADYSRPEGLSYALPKGYMLPTQQTNETIRHAEKGDRFFDAIIFDGTDADGPVDINTYIGKKLTPAEIKALSAGNKNIDASLLSPNAWHMRVAVFPLKDKDAMEPAYEMNMILHDNGVVSHALVDYGLFKVDQTLVGLEKLKPRKCGN